MEKKYELTKYEKASVERLHWIVDNLCAGSQIRLAESAGISKGAVSQYLKGKNTPSNLSAKKIADAFNLNPAWIMGFDVPMHEEPEEETDSFRQEMFDEDHVLFDYRQLSESSKATVRNVIKALKTQDESDNS